MTLTDTPPAVPAAPVRWHYAARLDERAEPRRARFLSPLRLRAVAAFDLSRHLQIDAGTYRHD